MFPFNSMMINYVDDGVVKLDPAWNLQSYDASSLSTCGITFNPDGSVTPIYNFSSDLPGEDNWWTTNPTVGFNIGDDYEVAVTAVTTGGFTIGPAINEWTSLSSSVTWSVRALSKNAPETVVANGVTFEIRPAGGGASVATITNCNHNASN